MLDDFGHVAFGEEIEIDKYRLLVELTRATKQRTNGIAACSYTTLLIQGVGDREVC